MGSPQECPRDPWNSVSRRVTRHFLERSFWKPKRMIMGVPGNESRGVVMGPVRDDEVEP